MNYNLVIYLFIILFQSTVGVIQKSSLTFVIDNTMSMSDDIQQVKYGVNLVFDTVLNSNASQIENFIIVTFKDPGVQLRTVTKDRGVFKSSLDQITLEGNYDCPEMSMAGIELALTESLPGSYLYVCTDASAKDQYLLESVKNLALKKTSQIVFLLTGRCDNNDNDPQYQAYYKLADATNGQVFHMTKNNVGEILKYVAETISSRKSVVTRKNFPPGYGHHMTIPVDAGMKDVVIAGSGKEPKIDITAPDGSKPHADHLVDIPEVVAVKIKDIKPGNYTAKVGSKSETSVMVTASTSIQFNHGFSIFEPASIKDTAIKPIPDQESHLAIQLITTEDDAVLNTVELTDLEENVIAEMPLKLIDAKQKLYDTASFIPPNSMFKITVKGYDNKSKSSFKRTSLTPVEPQNPSLVKYEDRVPTITIDGGLNINAEYNKPLKISCKINGFPKPDAIWLDSYGSILPSAYSTLEIPFDFINILEIDRVRHNTTYTCKAANAYGEDSKTVEVITFRKEIFNVIEAPKDTTIRYRNSGQVTCKIDADPPAKIRWLYKGKELRPDEYVDISPDYSIFTIKDMRKHLTGIFVCEATADTHVQQFFFNVTISGFERPKIEKADIEMVSKRGENVEIRCRIIKGEPTPKLVWYHLAPEYQQFIRLDETNEVLNFPNVEDDKAGFYRCMATNDAGSDYHLIQVIVEYPPNIIEDEKYIRSREGRETTLRCRTQGVPKPRVEWFLNGAKILSDRKHHIYRDNSLRFTGSTLNAGLFTCVASNQLGSANKTIRVDYFERPKIEKADIEMVSKRGENVEIRCRIIKGEPTPKLVWYHLAPGYQQFIRLDETNEVLNFPNVEEDKAGFYRCMATNDAGSDYHSIQVIVEYPPNIIEDEKYIRSREGRETTLRCRTQGVPKPRVEWFLNGAKILSDRKHHIYRDNSLRFTGSTLNAGLFTCVASNQLGSANKTIRVDYFVPVTIEPPKQSTFHVKEGDSLQLPCRADGYPQPTLKWIFFSFLGNTTLARKMRPSDVSGQLHLKDIRSFQDGFYTCVASNIESSVNITYRIKLAAPPKIIKGPTINYTAIDGDLITRIPCKATGYPKPDITWSKGGFNVASGSEWYNIEEDGTLIIKNLDRESAGAYVCKANNVFGVDMQTFNVIVKPFPDDTAPTKTITMEEGKSGVLNCDVPHTILDSVRWYKEKILLDVDASIILENVKVSDSGIYTCRVSNFAGSISESKRVVVGYKPTFIVEAETIINFNDGMPALLDCAAKGEPRPQVTWFYEDDEIEFDDFIFELLMTFDERGKHTCLVSNYFGNISRTFEISSKDCILNIEDDFTKNQPLMIDEDTLKWPQLENVNDNLKIPSNEGVLLYCPGGFANIPQFKVTAICDREANFVVDGSIYNYSDLRCQEEVQPIIKKTGRQCRHRNTEQIKIGYDVLGDFLEVFEVCFNKDSNLPIYAKQEISRLLADVELKQPMWHPDKLPLELNEVYQCDAQINFISSTLQKWFHADDRCCFDKRQLVNTRDLPGGLPQKAALNYLNVIPHWSTCNAKNWNELEKRVRKLAKSSFEKLMVWTGTSGQLTLNNVLGNTENITLRDNRGYQLPVPQYVWKVIQNPDTKSSLAVVQLNSPDLEIDEAYRQMLCTDICQNVEWMRGINWRDPTKGYTFCCSLPDFERAFGYTGHFGTGNNNILRDISGWLGGRSV